MSIEVKVPMLPESVADATVLKWHKKEGDPVARDETLVELETDKVVLEVPAPEDGVLESVLQKEGATVTANVVLAKIAPGKVAEKKEEKKTEKKAETAQAAAPAARATKVEEAAAAAPSVRRLAAERDVDVSKVTGSGKAGRVTKEDVMSQAKQQPAQTKTTPAAVPEMTGERAEQRVTMSRLRARIAERLVEAQHTAAMLTTFNEINMQPVMDCRNKYKDQFFETHGVRLGFMSFFIKAAIEALKRFPAVNASLDKQDIVYHGYYDIGVAVSTERGLVVPVIRDANQQSMADLEKSIADFANRARDNKLALEEIQGGTFTITNGGVFGSLLSTPIINPPQVAILGMHKIEMRPVAENNQVVIRPMMYVALTYDHRIIDGKESVHFLVTIKELLEDPLRLILEV